nr:hypothetical protein Itr_chr09CG05230 [Ipomoea trifida]
MKVGNVYFTTGRWQEHMQLVTKKQLSTILARESHILGDHLFRLILLVLVVLKPVQGRILISNSSETWETNNHW